MVVLSASIVAAMAPTVMAMPIDAAFDASYRAPLLLKTAANQHRVYPGSDDTSAQKARADRNAPNLFCEKQENKCE